MAKARRSDSLANVKELLPQFRSDGYASAFSGKLLSHGMASRAQASDFDAIAAPNLEA